MSTDVRTLNRYLKRYDSSLFAKEDDGIIRVYQRPEKGGEWHVCSLTDNWGFSGERREWGVLPVMEHIKRGSLEYRDRMNRELEKEKSVLEEAKDRSRKDLWENVARESLPTFKEAFKDVRTCNMDKSAKADVRYKREQSLKFKE